MSGSRDGHGASRTEWIVGEFDDSLIVMPANETLRLVVLNDALRDAATWADLLQRIGDHPDLLSEIRERCGDELPGASMPFDADRIYGFTEGNWPRHPKETMIDSVPDSIASLGVVSPTLSGESLLEIAPKHRREAIRRLRQLGDPYRENDGLISRACGAWRYG